MGFLISLIFYTIHLVGPLYLSIILSKWWLLGYLYSLPAALVWCLSLKMMRDCISEDDMKKYIRKFIGGV